jgi:hypothetical protein
VGVGLTWRLVYASAIGTSHTLTGTPCQDSCWAHVDRLADDQLLLSVFVADGAGSAAKGGEGGELAIEAAASFIAQRVDQGEFSLSDGLATDLVIAVRSRLNAAAEAEGRKVRDFACTFLGVLSTATGSLVLQIGDGGVVLDAGAGLEVAVVPMSGEYANMTHFVTDEDALTALVIKTYPTRIKRVAAFTDGIQRLALNLATNTPHEPFFAPFFNGMTRAIADQEDELHGLLVRFLNSGPVNERTDDDKTLALAVWMD